MERSDDSIKFITNVLSPGKVISIKLHDEDKSAVVEVADVQLSVEIGKSGQNVRLAARLTGWKIDLVGESGERPAPEEKTEAGEVVATPETETAAPTNEVAEEKTEETPAQDAATEPVSTETTE